MNILEFCSIIITLSALVKLYKDRKEIPKILCLAYNSIPLIMAICMIIIGMICIPLSPLAFNEDICIKGNSLTHAFGIFSIFITLALISLPLAKIFYNEYKDPKTNWTIE